ncbi:MAG: immune inhibitor A [Clostridia bacterium]|nr:immune inhibitor A [Clostridia bacterium]
MKKILAFIITFTMVCSMVTLADGAVVSGGYQGNNMEFSKKSTPPNEIGIAKMLINKGFIDKNATAQVIDNAVQDYIKTKLVPNKSKSMDKQTLLRKLKQNNATSLDYKKLLNGKKLGKKVTDLNGVEERKWDGSVRNAKLLILLAEFGSDQYGVGPLHNEIEKPSKENNTDLWVQDFSRDHYKKMLFTEGGYDAIDQNGEKLHLDSMVDYYMEQSGESYRVDGDVFGWFTLPHSEAFYGDDDPAGGHDNMQPGNSHDLVADLLKVAQTQGVPFEDYDIEDPYDMDGDGNIDEADGIIDHLVIVHAGVDQSGGGGAQGDNAIWAHSSSVFEMIPSSNPTVPYWDGNMLAYNYIIQGEDGSIGVFCHEFGHDLGLPDEYDTIYSGNGDPVGFYSLMSSGSWAGKPLGTKPSPFSPWGRMVLGQLWGGQWIQPTEVNYQDITKQGTVLKLDQTTSVGSNNQVIKVNLPDHPKLLTQPYEGSNEWFGGKGDEIDNTMSTTLTLPTASKIDLNFWTWYDIEESWDFGFVQVSTDEGKTWTSLTSSRTTGAIVPDGYPAIKANLPGYTGKSGGWVNEVIDLSKYAGQKIMLQFRYMTDWGTSLEGFYIDNIKVLADGNVVFEDNAENGTGSWSANGWNISQGFEMKSHYYMLEWRNLTKTDEALKYGYNWVDNANGVVEYYRHEPGMLVWYRDMAFDDNWVGVHPGQCFLGVVDSHPEPIVAGGDTLRSRIQIHDAAFGFDRVIDKVFTFLGKTKVLQGGQAVPEFNDYHSYWNPKAPDSGIKVPQYGLKFKVVGRSIDYSVGEIAIYK